MRLMTTSSPSFPNGRVGIVTIVNNAVDESFGPAMQIFAVQQFWRQRGYNAETIPDPGARRTALEKVLRGYDELKKGPSAISFILDKTIRKNPGRLSEGRTSYERALIARRKTAYRRFMEGRIAISRFTDADLRKGNPELDGYRYFAVGSDQVWNPYYPQRDEVKYLEFCDRRQRIAFVPSIAREDIPKRFRHSFVRGINGFDSLCIREEAGARLIRNFVHRDAVVLVDPTMILSPEVYRDMEEDSAVIPSHPYVFAYFMGMNSHEYEITNIARRLGAKLMRMRDFNEPELFVMNPSEYLKAIDDATLVCTDSFHVSVFAIMLHTPLLIFPKLEGGCLSTNSRLDTLLETFRLQHCIRRGDGAPIPNIDWSVIDGILACERQRASEYFDGAIEGGNYD